LLTQIAIQKFRSFIVKSISHGQCKIGTEAYKIPVHRVEVDADADGRVAVYMLIDHSIAGAVNQVQLYDWEGDLFADKAVNITKDTTQGVLIKLSFVIQEV
jgi:hypothetical protein